MTSGEGEEAVGYMLHRNEHEVEEGAGEVHGEEVGEVGEKQLGKWVGRHIQPDAVVSTHSNEAAA